MRRIEYTVTIKHKQICAVYSILQPLSTSRYVPYTVYCNIKHMQICCTVKKINGTWFLVMAFEANYKPINFRESLCHQQTGMLSSIDRDIVINRNGCCHQQTLDVVNRHWIFAFHSAGGRLLHDIWKFPYYFPKLLSCRILHNENIFYFSAMVFTCLNNLLNVD